MQNLLSPRAWAILWTVVVLVACWTPGGAVRGGGPDIPGLDKGVHTLLFFLESFFLLRALHGVFPARTLRGGRPTGRIASSSAAALAAGLAILTEIVQNWVPNRDGSLGDLLADFLGILLATAWYRQRDTEDERAHP